MMLTWIFWLSFWSALLGGPDEPILMPVPLALPVPRTSATVTNLAQWRSDHLPRIPQGPNGGEAA